MCSDNLNQKINLLYSNKMIQKIFLFDSISSTNDYLLYHYKGKLQESILIIANYQTKGKGQFKRAWIAKKDQSILSSLLLQIPKKKHYPDINLIMAQSICKSLKKYCHISTSIKKPNDILFHKKKLAGILSEVHSFHEHYIWLVLGFGINFHQKIDDFPTLLREKATSLFLATHSKYDRIFILNSILENFEKNYYRWKSL